MKILITLNDQGGGRMDWNYGELVSTLRATSNHPPIVVLEDEADNADREKILPMA